MKQSEKPLENPWVKIAKQWEKSNPKHFVLDEDSSLIKAFNESESQTNNYKIQTGMIPQPYMGNLSNCRVLLLLLNPGARIPPGLSDPDELIYYEKFPEYVKDNLHNLQQKKMDYPFILLNPKHRLSGGFKYWSRIFKPFLNNDGDYKKISEKICCLEYFPYHSKSFKGISKSPIASQEFTFNLVKKFSQKPRKERPMIILMRSSKRWFKAVEGLEKYKGLVKLTSRTISLSENVLGNNFEKLKKQLGDI